MSIERESDLAEIERQEERKRIIVSMREQGLENEEVRRLVTEWAKREEARTLGTAWGLERPIDIDIDIDCAQADMMAEAGFITEAVESLESTLQNAEQRGKDLLIKKIEARIGELETKL